MSPGRGRGRHVADKRAGEWDWEAAPAPAVPGAVPVMQPPETLPSGIDLSDLPRTAYVEAVTAGGTQAYPSRRALREARTQAAPTSVDELERPPGHPGAPAGVGAGVGAGIGTDIGADSAGPDDTEASGTGSPTAQGTASVMRSSALMAAGTLVSRILGMVRAIVLAWVIGLNLVGNTFQVSNSLPNNLYILVAGGALNAVLVPQISRAMRRGEEGRVYVDRLLSMSILLLAVMTVVLTAAAPLLVALLSDRWTPQQMALGVAFAYWCVPQVFFYGLYTLYGQVLNARGSFGPYMWAPVLNNVVAILGMLCFVAVSGADPLGRRTAQGWAPWEIALFAGTATLGVASQALVLVPVLRRSGFRLRWRWGLRGVGLGAASRIAGWTFAAVLVAQVGYVMASRVVSAGGAAADAVGGKGAGRIVYDNAYLMFVLPHSLVAVSVVTAVFTRMSRSAAAGRTDDVRADLSLALRTVGVATVLATAGFAVLARDLAAVMFAANRPEQAYVIGWVATAMAVGLVAYSAQYLSQRVFYAYEDAKTPFGVQVASTATWILGLLVVRATVDAPSIVFGAGAALALSLVVGAGLSLVLVRRRIGGIDGARVLRTHVRLGVAAGMAAVAGWSVSTVVHHFLGIGGRASAVSLLAASVIMLGIYGAVLKVLGVRELDDLLRPVLGRLTGR